MKFKQRDITDCGAACLASVASFYGLQLPLSRIRQLAGTDRKGTNVLGLVEAATKMGFDARGVRGQEDSLLKIPKPAIAHVIIGGGLHHFVVITRVSPACIEVMDPGDGALHTFSYVDFKKIWTGVLVLLLPNNTFTPGRKTISLHTRFFSILSASRFPLLISGAAALAYTVFGLTTTIFIQKIVDEVLAGNNQLLLNTFGMIMMIMLAFQVFSGLTKNILTLQTGQQIDSTLILGYYRHILRLPQSFFDSMRTGEIISRIHDAVKIRSFVNEALTNAVVNIFFISLSVILMFTVHSRLALLALSVVPLYALVYYLTNRFNRRTERKVMEHAAALESHLVESINAISTIKCNTLEINSDKKTETRFKDLLRWVYSSGRTSIFSGSASDLLSRIMTLTVLWCGAGFVLDHAITTGELLSVFTLVAFFTGPVNGLLSINKTVQNAMIAADRLFEIMDLEPEEVPGDKVNHFNARGSIVFRNVSFRYGTRTQVFQNLNLTIEPGVTAVVGESGSGKSTLAALLLNLYPISKGAIEIGGQDIRNVSLITLRKVIGVVPQKIDLFAGTLLENIVQDSPDQDMDKALMICHQLGMAEFIEKLPAGIHSQVGENGSSLSGGEKQRVALVRALYRDPEILILDEATSSLDSTSEKYVQQVLDSTRRDGKTIILIAHRLSTVANADRIIVLDRGIVSETGSHPDLLKSKGDYFRLWKNQFPMIESLHPALSS